MGASSDKSLQPICICRPKLKVFMDPLLLMVIAAVLLFPAGVVVGWHQRNKDKKRDNYELAEHILRQAEGNDKPKNGILRLIRREP